MLCTKFVFNLAHIQIRFDLMNTQELRLWKNLFFGVQTLGVFEGLVFDKNNYTYMTLEKKTRMIFLRHNSKNAVNWN